MGNESVEDGKETDLLKDARKGYYKGLVPLLNQFVRKSEVLKISIS